MLLKPMKAGIVFLPTCAALVLAAGCHTRKAAPAAPVQLPVPAAAVPDARVPKYFSNGKLSLRRGRPAAAVRDFHRCLVIEPGNRDCLDGKGRAQAAMRHWEDAVAAWEELSLQVPGDKDLEKRLAAARRAWEAHKRRRAKAASHVLIGTVSVPADAPLRLRLAARFQHYSTTTLSAADVYDADIDSPKSVVISTDGVTAYVNSLEGICTVVYDAARPAKRGVIRHSFGAKHAGLFPGREPWFGYKFSEDLPPEGPNVFNGKPVEGALSHGGRYLWVPYYRRNYDLDGTQPSAVAVIDAAAGAIVRVLPAGPIAKNVAASPDGRYVALAHWGGNSVGFIDISSSEPAGFSPAGLVVLGSTAPPAGAEGMDRDRECGLCVRGLAWSPDSKTLFAGCMGGAGGVAVIDAGRQGWPALTGRVALGGNPRDLAVSPDGKWLFAASSAGGTVLRAEAGSVAEAASSKNGYDIALTSVKVGGTPRSMRLSPDGKWLFAALNSDSQVVVVDARKMEVVARVGADSFPVGMDVSPDGRFLWVTSQGINGAGGNSVEIFEITTVSAAPRHKVPPLP